MQYSPEVPDQAVEILELLISRVLADRAEHAAGIRAIEALRRHFRDLAATQPKPPAG